jgi:hypothetical protein
MNGDRRDGGGDGIPRLATVWVALISGLLSVVVSISLFGWKLRGYVDEIEDARERIEQIDAAAVERSRYGRELVAELRGEVLANNARYLADVERRDAADRAVDRRLLLAEERLQRLLHALERIQGPMPPNAGAGGDAPQRP